MSEDQAFEAVSAQAVTVGGVPVLRVTGEIDMGSVDTVRAELLAWLESASDRVVLDLTGVMFLASSGLALLVEAARHAERCGVRFVVAAGHRAVLRSIKATQLDEVFDIYPDVDQAVATVSATAPTEPASEKV
ncbi:STAS domain-containing protein [Saccharothrix isguenensis]